MALEVSESQIFPVMPYLLSLNISKDMLVQAINLSFTLSGIIMLAVMWRIEILNIHSAFTYSLTIFPVAISVYIGGKLRNKLSEDRFKQ